MHDDPPRPIILPVGTIPLRGTTLTPVGSPGNSPPTYMEYFPSPKVPFVENLMVCGPLSPHKTIVYVTDLKMVKSNLRPKNYFVLSRDPRSVLRVRGRAVWVSEGFRPENIVLVGNFPAFETERIQIYHARHAWGQTRHPTPSSPTHHLPSPTNQIR